MREAVCYNPGSGADHGGGVRKVSQSRHQWVRSYEMMLARLIGGGNRMTPDVYLPGMFRSTRFPNLFHLGSRITMTSSSSPRSRLRIHTAAPEVADAVAAGQLDGGIVV